jgi:hypothetical protein
MLGKPYLVLTRYACYRILTKTNTHQNLLSGYKKRMCIARNRVHVVFCSTRCPNGSSVFSCFSEILTSSHRPVILNSTQIHGCTLENSSITPPPSLLHFSTKRILDQEQNGRSYPESNRGRPDVLHYEL